MAGVFISYRREDSPGHAGRVFDRVRARFGPDVFMDVTAIDAGADFVDAIEKAVGTCDVLLAIIGPQWVGAADSAGRKRLDNPNDFVRLEIAGALKRNVRVVPVLVDGARLPAPGDLPDDLQPLLRRNAVEPRDARWDADINELITSLERIVTQREGSLRLEAPPRRRARWVAALAVLAVSVGAGLVFGPRACTTAPAGTATAVTPPAATAPPPAAAPAVQSPGPATPRATAPVTVPVPSVVGRSLSDAREILRRAGVDVARVLYRDDRTKAIDLVVLQSDVRTSASSPRSVALTVVARAAVVIHHRPEDADVARRLAGALMANQTAAGLAVRTLEMPALRPDAIARVTYGDGALAGAAADVARDAGTWLAQNEPSRPALTAALYPPVVSRTIVIGLPGPGGTTSAASGPLPDVRGLTLTEARRRLFAAGVTTFNYKWSADRDRKPLEVVDQSEILSRTGGRRIVLTSIAKGTLVVFYLASDEPIVERLAEALTAKMNGLGIVVRPLRQSVIKPNLVGRVVSADGLTREAAMIAEFASSWLTTELGRPVRIDASTDRMGSREIMFGLPSQLVTR